MTRYCAICGGKDNNAHGNMPHAFTTEPEPEDHPGVAAARGKQIRELVDAQVSALDAMGKHLDRFDKVVLAGAAVDVLWPVAQVDMPSWPGETQGEMWERWKLEKRAKQKREGKP